MLCNAFVMLYLKDGPLRRSSECIGLCNAVPKRRSLKEFRLSLAKCMVLYYILQDISNAKGEKGGGGNEG